MVNSEVTTILDLFRSKDWSEYFLYFSNNLKTNIWFNIGNIAEFSFVRDIINRDLKQINVNYFCSEWITFLIYEPGGYFRKHIDGPSYSSNDQSTVLSGGYLLNKNYKGGDFIIKNRILNKNVGELFTFDRDAIHEVTEVLEGTRYSLHFAVNSIKEKTVI